MPERWDNAAILRQEQIESGIDLTFSEVFLPYYKELISEYKPSSVLEVGCGTGHLSHEICKVVPKVVAIEPSSGMFKVAQKVLCKTNVEVIQNNIQNFESQSIFEMVISHMCVQTINDISNFFKSVGRFISTKALFVFTIPHPCFYNDYKNFFPDNEFSYMDVTKKEITFSISKDPSRPITGVPYNHRPISSYFKNLNNNNMVAIDFHEIFPNPQVHCLYDKPWEIPRYCVFHVKRNH